MSHIPDIDGDSREGLNEYYERAETEIQNAVRRMDEQQLVNTDSDELTKYYVSKYILPKLEEDKIRKRTWNKGKSVVKRYSSYIPITIGIPLVPVERIDQVISRKAQSYLMSFSFGLEDCQMITSFEVTADGNIEGSVEQNFGYLQQTINHKNTTVEDGNKKLEQSVKNFIEQLQERIRNENEQVDSAMEKVSIELEKKTENIPLVDLKVRESVELVMPKPQEKSVDPDLNRKTLEKVIDYIDTQGRNFELTPKSFADLGEDALRDHIRALLNTIFKGSTTGESFVKTGKTDILLQHPQIQGGILSAECKFWDGEKLYQETIDQHFGYLTLRQNYAIQITFSKKRGFTDVCEKAMNATESHPTHIQGSTKKIEESYFITQHTFPEDSKKKVEIHHLLYNLYYKEKEN